MISLAQKIDKQLLKELVCKNLPKPLDALNLITFNDISSYHLYGFLLGPLVLLMGGRPVIVLRHEKSIYGEKFADELVIIRYPSHRVLLKIVNTMYYDFVNQWREKGVKTFEFSLTKQNYGSNKIRYQGLCLVLHYNICSEPTDSTLVNLKNIIDENNCHLLYASYETGTLNIFKSSIVSGINPAQYKQTAIFKFMTNGSNDIVEKTIISKIQTIVDDFSLQLYHTLSIKETTPWAKRIGKVKNN